MGTVDVVHIPDTGLPLKIVTLPLVPTARLKTTAGSHRCERYFSHVPDVKVYGDWLRAADKYRELVDLGTLDPNQPAQQRSRQIGPYFMYKFSIDARVALSSFPNLHFKRAKGAEDVYGNAYIFKVKEPAFERGVVEFEDLDEDFIRSAFEGRGIAATESLEWLSRQYASEVSALMRY